METSLIVDSPTSLGHCWGLGNRLVVYSTADRLDAKPVKGCTIHEVRWDVSMSSNEFMRRLAKSSFDVFRAMQKNTDPDKYISFSMQYRAALAVCSQEILQFLRLNEDVNEAKAMHLAAECELVKNLELIWHLAELIFIQAYPSGYLAYNLCSWFHVQCQEWVDYARLLIDKAKGRDTECLESDDRFWPTVLALVLQARPHEAASVLTLHSHANSRGLRSLRQLLVSMPIATQSRGKDSWANSGAAFSQAWSYWQSECSQRVSCKEFDHVGGDPVSTSYVQLIVSILAGSQSPWNDEKVLEVTDGACGWYFRFVSFLFYTDQMITTDRLESHLNRWLARPEHSNIVHGSSQEEVVDKLIKSIFRLELQSFIVAASEKLNNWWLVAHFTNLLQHVYPDTLFTVNSNGKRGTPKLQSQLKSEERDSSGVSTFPKNGQSISSRARPSLPDFFLTGYAESLASELSLFGIALGYLDYCEGGESRQAALIQAHGAPLSTRGMNWFMTQARSRELYSTSQQLARTMARSLLPLAMNDGGNITESSVSATYYPTCAALGWAVLGQDHSVINRLAQQTLANDSGPLTTTSCSLDHTSKVDGLRNSTEIAEMAAIILGFCHNRTTFDDQSDSLDKRSSDEPQRNQLRLSPELTFLVRYAELQQCFVEGNTENAIDRLIDLLVTGSSVPGYTRRGKDDSQHNKLSYCRISTCLRLRLLMEMRHLLGKHCMRRDQVELLLASLVDLRMDLEKDKDSYDKDVLSNLPSIHASLACELAATMFPQELNEDQVPMTDSPT
ncbi:unnamed protein product [Calicophoron daubneyi]|uniref:Nuclear pore complex protein Nup85 n=1 Tax=Calicophoron daubneyi TaxID=300641 RepID=A0AAV2T233_CALDB